jgi:hypothetical protein
VGAGVADDAERRAFAQHLLRATWTGDVRALCDPRLCHLAVSQDAEEPAKSSCPRRKVTLFASLPPSRTPLVAHDRLFAFAFDLLLSPCSARYLARPEGASKSFRLQSAVSCAPATGESLIFHFVSSKRSPIPSSANKRDNLILDRFLLSPPKQ